MQNSIASPVPLPQAAPVPAMWGLFERKERWSLSWRGCMVVASAFLLVGALCVRGVYPFLAVTHRVKSNVLVVEGWVHEYAIQAAVNEFRSGGYSRVFTTGGPIEGNGHYINDYNTSASVGAGLLRKKGLASASVQMVPSRIIDRDRTYGAAVALRHWLRDHDIKISGINVLTENVHARRSQLLFQKALGSSVRVGIIAVRNPDYEQKRWWSCSEGVRDVIGEIVAYVYAKLFFHPIGRPPAWEKSGNFASNLSDFYRTTESSWRTFALLSTHSDKMRIDDVQSLSTLSSPMLSDACTEL